MSPTSSRKRVPPSARSKVPRFSVGVPAGPRRHGSVAVAEEFGFDVVFGDGGAVEFDEDAILAQGFGVHGAADEFFAGAGFAVDEDAAVGGGHELDLLAEGLHGDGVAGDGGAEGELADELLVVLAELAGVDGVLEDDEGAVERERLFEEVVGAELGGADGGFDGAVAGDDDDFGDVRGVHLADVAEGVEAVAVGEPDVEEDGVVDGVGEQGEGFAGGGGSGDDVTLLGEDGFEGVADFGFVVDDEDVVHREGTRFEVRGSRWMRFTWLWYSVLGLVYPSPYRFLHNLRNKALRSGPILQNLDNRGDNLQDIQNAGVRLIWSFWRHKPAAVDSVSSLYTRGVEERFLDRRVLARAFSPRGRFGFDGRRLA